MASKTSKYYRDNPKAAEKRRKWQRKENKKKKKKLYRAFLNRMRRKARAPTRRMIRAIQARRLSAAISA